MFDILIALGISLAGFALQVWPRLINRYFGIDTWRFTLLAQYIRARMAFYLLTLAAPLEASNLFERAAD